MVGIYFTYQIVQGLLLNKHIMQYMKFRQAADAVKIKGGSLMRRTISALLTLAVLVLSGCGGTGNGDAKLADSKMGTDTKQEVKLAQGISDTSIKIGTIGPLTGTYGAAGVSMLHGMQAYFNKINDAGGIDGKRIELIYKDDQMKPELSKQKAQELVEKDKVFAIVGQLGTSGCLASADYFKEKGIPCVSQGTGSSNFSKILSNYFPVQPNYVTEGQLVAKYAVDKLKAQKIVIIYENSDIGKSELSGVEEELKKPGREKIVLEPIAFNPSDNDFSVPVKKAIDIKSDVTILASMQKQTSALLLEAQKQGYKSQFIGSYICADISFLSLTKDAANGFIIPAWIPDIEDPNNKDAKEMTDTYKKYFPDETCSALTAAGWVSAEVFVEGLNRMGKDNPTWGGFIKGMETIKGFNCLAKGITYTAESRNGVESMYFMKANYVDEKNMKFDIISGFLALGQ